MQKRLWSWGLEWRRFENLKRGLVISFMIKSINSELFIEIIFSIVNKTFKLQIFSEILKFETCSLDGLRLQVAQLQSELNNPVRSATPAKDRLDVKY